MIINNKHIQGIFLYSNEIEFEKGDFVVSNNCIYICTAKYPTNIINNTVSGISPDLDDSGNYITYLGDKISSVEEYYDYINNMSGNNSIGSDKYISSHTLNKILENLMFGVDSNGIITENVLSDGTCSINLSEAIKDLSDESVLDKILKCDKINNGMIRISRQLVRHLIGYDQDFPNTSDGKSVILKQYSYLDENDITVKIRVQELIDHIKGIVTYRYCKGILDSNGNWIFESNGVPWKHSFLNEDFLKDVNSVYSFIDNRYKELNNIKRDLIGNFKYRELDLPIDKTNTITIYSSSIKGINNFYEGCVLTINIQTLFNSNIFKNNSITIDIADSLTNNPIVNYYVSENIILSLTDIDENKVTITTNSGIISDIYYRQNFKL